MDPVRLFLCGDVMTGRGIDQILAHPSDPAIHEDYVESALDYVQLAETACGPIPRGVAADYIWGDTLEALERFQPDLRIVNLETAVTTGEDWLPKGINYRMHPANVNCLTAAHIDCCCLANNHLLDWGTSGLLDTVAVLQEAKIQTAGAGRDRAAATAPAIFAVPGKARLVIHGVAMESSGVHPSQAAQPQKPGVGYLADLSGPSARQLVQRLESARQPGDIVLMSIHWGPNWGYRIPGAARDFAHALIDAGAVDVVHGHSSHHPKGIEVYRDRLILYGCGDFINDYEGIAGREAYRGQVGMMILPELDVPTGKLRRLQLVVTRIERFQVRRAPESDARWLCGILEREGERLGTGCRQSGNAWLEVTWPAALA